MQLFYVFQWLIALDANKGPVSGLLLRSSPPSGPGDRLERDLASICADVKLLRVDEGFPVYGRHGELEMIFFVAEIVFSEKLGDEKSKTLKPTGCLYTYTCLFEV